MISCFLLARDIQNLFCGCACLRFLLCNGGNFIDLQCYGTLGICHVLGQFGLYDWILGEQDLASVSLYFYVTSCASISFFKKVKTRRRQSLGFKESRLHLSIKHWIHRRGTSIWSNCLRSKIQFGQKENRSKIQLSLVIGTVDHSSATYCVQVKSL